MQLVKMFQFHIGAIRSVFLALTFQIGFFSFQFHIGAIRRVVPFVLFPKQAEVSIPYWCN